MYIIADSKVKQDRLRAKLKALREIAGYTLEEAGFLTGFSRQAIDNWEQGYKPINDDYVKALARICMVSLESLTDPYSELQFSTLDQLPSRLYRALINLALKTNSEQVAFLALLEAHEATPQVGPGSNRNKQRSRS